MTDRVNYLTVVLKNNMRDDDVLPLIAAITLLNGVATVGMNVVSPNDYSAVEQAKHDLRMKIISLIV